MQIIISNAITNQEASLGCVFEVWMRLNKMKGFFSNFHLQNFSSVSTKC